jgi:hypothetical protein
MMPKPNPQSPRRRVLTLAVRLTLCLMPCSLLIATPTHSAEPDATTFISFSEDFAGLCVSRNGVQIQVRNTHPTRKLRVWLDRIHMGVGTGDRSRSDLAPGAEPEPLGCSRSLSGPQEWRVVRAVFLD